MKIKSFKARDPDITLATALKVQALERKIDRLIALDKARANVQRIKQAGQRGYRSKKKASDKPAQTSEIAPAATTHKPRPAAFDRSQIVPGSNALPWKFVPAFFRKLAVGDSVESIWPAHATLENLPPTLYAVDPGPPVMVRRIAPDPEEPAGASSEPAAGELAQVAPESATA